MLALIACAVWMAVPSSASKPAPRSLVLKHSAVRQHVAAQPDPKMFQVKKNTTIQDKSEAKENEAPVKKDASAQDEVKRTKPQTSVVAKDAGKIQENAASNRKDAQSAYANFMKAASEEKASTHRDPPNIHDPKKGADIGETISTCGGSEDTKGSIQMEQTNNKPCKFPFTYEGKTYNDCVEEGTTDRKWCFTDWPEPGKEGITYWAICNYDKSTCPETSTHLGQQQANADLAKKIEAASSNLHVWFEWWYWQPLFSCGVSILIFTEILWPIVDRLISGSKTLFVVHALMFACAMMAFFYCAAIFTDPKAAAASHILGLSTLFVVLGLLTLLGALGISVRALFSQKGMLSAVADDFAALLLPLTRLMLTFLITYGVLENVDTSYSGIVTLAAFAMIGISMALTGIVSDFIAYIFIRANGWFQEGDFIYHNGGLIKVVDIEWRHTKAFSFAHKCIVYIPNGLLGNKELINQSQDEGRVVFTDIPLNPKVTGETLEAIVKDAWELLRSQDKPFTALNGKTFENQLDVGASGVFISDYGAATSAKELAQIHLKVKLTAQYYYSKPPVKVPEGEDWREHQWDWIAGWNFQTELIFIGIQKILDKHAAK